MLLPPTRSPLIFFICDSLHWARLKHFTYEEIFFQSSACLCFAFPHFCSSHIHLLDQSSTFFFLSRLFFVLTLTLLLWDSSANLSVCLSASLSLSLSSLGLSLQPFTRYSSRDSRVNSRQSRFARFHPLYKVTCFHLFSFSSLGHSSIIASFSFAFLWRLLFYSCIHCSRTRVQRTFTFTAPRSTTLIFMLRIFNSTSSFLPRVSLWRQHL